MAEENPKNNQGTTSSKIVSRAKEFVATAQSAVVKQGDNIKSKVAGPAGDILEATKNGVVQYVDKAQGYLNPSKTEKTPKTDQATGGLVPPTSEIVSQAKDLAEADGTAAVKQGDDIKSKDAEVTNNQGASGSPEGESIGDDNIKTKAIGATGDILEAEDHLNSVTTTGPATTPDEGGNKE